jgi:hypothetical protein
MYPRTITFAGPAWTTNRPPDPWAALKAIAVTLTLLQFPEFGQDKLKCLPGMILIINPAHHPQYGMEQQPGFKS